MRWQLVHRTSYRFPQDVVLGPHEIRLCPRPPFRGQHRLQVWPRPSMVYPRTDPWQSPLLQLWFREPTRELQIVNRLQHRWEKVNPFAFAVEAGSLHFPPAPLDGLQPYLQVRESGPTFESWVADWRRPGEYSTALAIAINEAIHDRIAYGKREASGWQSPEETLQLGSGTCRDTAWLLVQTLRALGYPARYVSGYWVQVEGSSAELHAWAELFLAGAGWIGLDPTARLLTSHQHVPLCHAPNPEATLPVIGSHAGGQPAEMEWSVQVRRCR